MLNKLVPIALALACPATALATNFDTGAAKAQQFFNNNKPSVGSITNTVTNNMPATQNDLNAAAQATQSQNSGSLQDAQSAQWSQDMMAAVTSGSGSCDITDVRNYCESAMWQASKRVTKSVAGQSAPVAATISACSQFVSPPAGFTNADLVKASGGMNQFTGTVTCNYTKTGNVVTQSFTGLAIDGSAFMDVTPSTSTITFTTLVNPAAQATVDNECKTQNGWVNGVPPKGFVYVSGTVTSYQ